VLCPDGPPEHVHRTGQHILRQDSRPTGDVVSTNQVYDAPRIVRGVRHTRIAFQSAGADLSTSATSNAGFHALTQAISPVSSFTSACDNRSYQ
jgi:hypothetical protein